jgi:U4/U6 small nuclear ribonucleoprotein PRP4
MISNTGSSSSSFSEGPSPLLGQDAIAAAIRSGNVNIAGSMQVQVLDLSAESREAQVKHAEHLRRFEAQQRARSIVVPTSAMEVMLKLRELGHPITLFGEGAADRRERLKEVIAQMELNDEELQKVQAIMNQASGAESSTVMASAMTTGTGVAPSTSISASGVQKEVFYSPATEALVSARKKISSWSFDRAQDRLKGTKRTRQSEDLQQDEDRAALSLYANARKLALAGSEFADERALTCIRYSPDGQSIATGSLACNVKLWSKTSMHCTKRLNGHVERITGIAWSGANQDAETKLLATSSADASCIVWDASHVSESEMETDGDGGTQHGSFLMRKLVGHQGVVADCDFHPIGRHIGTAGHDYTWRFWDIETGTELQLQDGHIRECSTISFQCDGSLVLTGDWAGVALLWDLRSGQCIQTFQGHVQKIVCSSFSPTGFQVATGSTDNNVRVWDLRKKKCFYTLPAHSNVISDLKYSSSSELLATSSFDGTVKLWNARDFELLHSLSGHTGRVMACDISPDELDVVTAGFDRTVKIWSSR